MLATCLLRPEACHQGPAQAAHWQHRSHPSLPHLSPPKQHACSALALSPVRLWLTPTAFIGRRLSSWRQFCTHTYLMHQP